MEAAAGTTLERGDLKRVVCSGQGIAPAEAVPSASRGRFPSHQHSCKPTHPSINLHPLPQPHHLQP